MSSLWVSPYIPIYWTKRYVRPRPTSLRIRLRSQKQKNRIKKRYTLFQIEHLISCKRKPYRPKHPQCRNYNSFYRPMQIPIY